MKGRRKPVSVPPELRPARWRRYGTDHTDRRSSTFGGIKSVINFTDGCEYIGSMRFSVPRINLKNTFAICDIGIWAQRVRGEAGSVVGVFLSSGVVADCATHTLTSHPGSVVSLRGGFMRTCKSNLSSLEQPRSRRYECFPFFRGWRWLFRRFTPYYIRFFTCFSELNEFYNFFKIAEST